MSYLQIGNLGGTGLASVGVVVFVIAVVLTYWVYQDASGRGRDRALGWALGVGILTLLTLLGGVIAFGVYLYTRS